MRQFYTLTATYKGRKEVATSFHDSTLDATWWAITYILDHAYSGTGRITTRHKTWAFGKVSLCDHEGNEIHHMDEKEAV